eukprot:1135395_1
MQLMQKSESKFKHIKPWIAEYVENELTHRNHDKDMFYCGKITGARWLLETKCNWKEDQSEFERYDPSPFELHNVKTQLTISDSKHSIICYMNRRFPRQHDLQNRIIRLKTFGLGIQSNND